MKAQVSRAKCQRSTLAPVGALYDITDETAAINRERSLAFTGKPLMEMVLSVNFFSGWNDQKTRDLGKTMTPPAYQTLPPGPIDINSIQGLNLRIRTIGDGLFGRPPREVYKGWEKDYNAGKESNNQ